MRVLLVGGGARECIIAEQLARSAEVYVAMNEGNPGISHISQKVLICDYSNIEAIGSWAIMSKIDIALVTSETALAKGVVDALKEAGIAVASPPSSGSVIGENTIYTLNLMESAGIPRPEFMVCKKQVEIKKAIKEFDKFVVKPAVKIEMKGTKFGSADFKKTNDVLDYGKKLIKRHGSVIVEGMVDGEVFSIHGITDGRTISFMPPVHVAKRALEEDKGDITDGMGGFTSGKLLPYMKQSDLDKAHAYLWRLVKIMRAKGVAYRGAILGNFMITKKGVVMLDARASFGNTEALNNFTALRSHFADILVSVMEGSLKQMSFYEMATVSKYLVPEKYPKSTRKKEVKVNERTVWDNGSKYYFNSIETKDGKTYTSKGRTLAICAKATDIKEANLKIEGAVGGITGKLRHRRDIASSKYVTRLVKRIALLRGYSY